MEATPDWSEDSRHWWVVDDAFRVVDGSFVGAPIAVEDFGGLGAEDLDGMVLAHFRVNETDPAVLHVTWNGVPARVVLAASNDRADIRIVGCASRVEVA